MKTSPDRTVRIEACVNSTASAIEAQRGGAFRVELCDNLHDGGTTPGPGSIVAAREHLDIRLNVIIRPRGGDFLYSDLDFEIMKTEIAWCREHGVDGVVFGLLHADGSVDRERTATLVELSGPMSTTFHRAFDMTKDPMASLQELIDLGLDRVLTSGQRPAALAGEDLIADLVRTAGDRIVIMPGVGIDADNIAEIVRRTGACEFHVLAEQTVASAMRYRNEAVFMGSDPGPSEFEVRLTAADLIRQICHNAAKAAGEGIDCDGA